jgi:GWxTD domain-containing protein
MKTVFRAITLLLFAVSLPGLGAGLERYKDWSKSPEFQFLATEAEQKEWKKITTDEQADKFVQLFWAKRDPDLKTPVNEYKIGFDKRVKEADELFSLPRLRGALTERGKAYIVIGKPKELKRSAGQMPQPTPKMTANGLQVPPPNPEGASIGESIVTFTWEAEYLPEWTKMKSLSATFIVEQSRDFVSAQTGDVKRLASNARAALIRNPDLKEAPHYRTAEELEAERQAALAAEAEARKGPALTPAVRAALEGVAEDTGLLAVVPLAGGDSDDTRVQAQLFLPASAGEIPADSRLAFLVRSADGKDAARFEESTAFEPAAGGRFASRWFSVPPGDYVVAAGVFDPSGKALAAARKPVSVAAVPAEFAISPLIVAAAFYPVPNPRPEDAYTFSGHRFIAKGARLDPADGLMFVVRVYNPAVDPATKAVSLSRTVRLKPKGSPGMDLPQPQDPPIPAPDRKDSKGILTVDVSAILIETKLGDYLRKPGEYDLKVVVTDNVSKKTAEGVGTFVVTGAAPAKK